VNQELWIVKSTVILGCRSPIIKENHFGWVAIIVDPLHYGQFPAVGSLIPSSHQYHYWKIDHQWRFSRDATRFGHRRIHHLWRNVHFGHCSVLTKFRIDYWWRCSQKGHRIDRGVGHKICVAMCSRSVHVVTKQLGHI
jgi:hypothetical protein